MNLKTLRDTHFGEDGTNSRMFYLCSLLDGLNRRVNDTMFVFKKWGQSPRRYVAIFIYCHSKNSTTMFTDPVRVICAATKQ